MREAMKYFPKKLLGHKNFVVWSAGVRIFFEKFVKPSGPTSYILNVRSLKLSKTQKNKLKNDFFLHNYLSPVDSGRRNCEELANFRWSCFTKATLLTEKLLLFNCSPAKTPNNRWQYFLIECRCLRLRYIAKF